MKRKSGRWLAMFILLPGASGADGLDPQTAAALAACADSPAGLRACIEALDESCAETQSANLCYYTLGNGLLDLVAPQRSDPEIDAIAAGFVDLGNRFCTHVADAESDIATRNAVHAWCIFESRLSLVELFSLSD